MPISQENQVDFLFKKIGYSIAKTANTSSKSPANESISSNLILRADTIWGQSASIPSTQPASSAGVVTVYSDANVNSVQTVEDSTSPAKKTWKTNLTNWIDASFGSTYAVKVYLDTTGSTTPQSTGTQLFPDGSGSNDFWFFDYAAGVLIFPDAIPTAVSGGSGKSIFVVGARYTGAVGISATLPIFTGNIGAGNVSATAFYGNLIGTDVSLSRILKAGGNIVAASIAVSTNSTTGALVVSGGVGVAGNINIAGSAGNAIVTTANIYAGNIVVTNNIYAPNAMVDRGSDSPNWNLLTLMGTYLVNRSSWSGTSNTPTDTTNYTGLLEVLNTSDSAIVQNYRPYDANTVTNNYWTRTRFNNVWSSWVEIINNSGYLDGGTF